MSNASPARLRIMNLDTQEVLTAQFNPQQLEINVKANYVDHVIPGMSHELSMYSHTSNTAFDLDLVFHVRAPRSDVSPRFAAQSTAEQFTIEDRESAENFLHALCVPRGGADSVDRNSPPHALVIWPQFLSVVVRVNNVKFRYTRFNRQGAPTRLVATASVSQMRRARYTSLDARVQGFTNGGGEHLEDS